MQGMSASDPGEQLEVLRMLVASSAGTGLMHESFDPDGPHQFTRPWFAWANSLFAQFVLSWAHHTEDMGISSMTRRPAGL
jgi:meiotically up-regulated gene 157 (Mug157) protein